MVNYGHPRQVKTMEYYPNGALKRVEYAQAILIEPEAIQPLDYPQTHLEQDRGAFRSWVVRHIRPYL